MTNVDPPNPTPAGGEEPPHQLTCGADTDDLLEQVADGKGTQLTDHQRGCQYCQAALVEYTELWAPVARAAALPVVAPVGAAAALIAGVMAEARASALPSSPTASGGSVGRVAHLGRWISLLVGIVIIAAIVTLIVLANGRDDSGPGAGIANPTVVATQSQAPASAIVTSPAPPSSTAATTAARTGLPTAVPAGTGGQAAPSGGGPPYWSLGLLGAGIALIAASGAYLVRRRGLACRHRRAG
ncbi:MAG: hypothetical protein JWM76_2973 [Pseudonocardiales bacterium]|nr:hypothetical protein [Pseudonocardiales bacterium]